MKRRSTTRKRDREMEEVKRLTTVVMPAESVRARLERELEHYRERLRVVLRERNDLEKVLRDTEQEEEACYLHFRGVYMTVQTALSVCADEIKLFSGYVRNAKEKLAALEGGEDV